MSFDQTGVVRLLFLEREFLINCCKMAPRQTRKNPPKTEAPPPKRIRTKPSTRQMADEALTAAKSVRGISLYAIKKYIIEKYELEFSKQRYAMLKKYLHELLEQHILGNVSGNGLNGRMRLLTNAARKKLSKTNPIAVETDTHTHTPVPTTNKGRGRKPQQSNAPKKKQKTRRVLHQIHQPVAAEYEGTPRSSLTFPSRLHLEQRSFEGSDNVFEGDPMQT